MTTRVVVASGYFNPLHYGHVSYLQKAKDAGTTLIVIVNNDKQVALRSREQAGRTVTHFQPARERVRLLRSLDCVDAAIEAVDEDESVADTLRLIHPDVFANGGSQVANEKEAAVCLELGIAFLDGLGVELLLLKPTTKNYDWGKDRQSSLVASLSGQQDVTSPDRQSPSKFAELWMGDHPSAPSSVRLPGSKESADCLRDTLKRGPSMLGEKLAGDGRLPFLLKVLSIQKALSIQAHPDRTRAARLHAERPDVYPDPNHKPEIAIALSDGFEALCGFRRVAQIAELIEVVPELRSLLGEAAATALVQAKCDDDKEEMALREAYGVLMHASDAVVRDHVQRLLVRVEEPLPETHPECLPDIYMLVKRVHGDYGVDVGIFSLFFLNYARLGIGQCLYMAQNVPHAYLSGDIVECMSCSDNVVRGGLTPKFKDIEVLCEMLQYKGGDPHLVKPTEAEPGVRLYADPAIEEFQVTHTSLPAGQRRWQCFSSRGPSMAFALRGEGYLNLSGETTVLEPGVVFLLGAGAEGEIEAGTNLDIFVACCPPNYFGGTGFAPPVRTGVEAEKK